MYKCQNKCIKCIKNQEPRHLFIKKLYFGFFQTFKAYIYIYIGSPNKIFILSPAGFFISPVRNLLLGLTPENFLKFEIFSGESSRPHRRTETVYVSDEQIKKKKAKQKQNSKNSEDRY